MIYFKTATERNLHKKMLELCGLAPIRLEFGRSNKYPIMVLVLPTVQYHYLVMFNLENS